MKRNSSFLLFWILVFVLFLHVLCMHVHLFSDQLISCFYSYVVLFSKDKVKKNGLHY